MTGEEHQARLAICELGASLFDRGLTAGSSGNLSVRLADGFLITPTNSSLGRLDPDRLSRLDVEGNSVAGDPPSKEVPLHLAAYSSRPEAKAVVHLHSPYSVVVSMLVGTDPGCALPPLTAYYVMRVGRVPVVPYFAPGDPAVAYEVKALMTAHRAVLLANHGSVVAGSSLEDAVYAAEELEATGQLLLLAAGRPIKVLTPLQLSELNERFGAVW